MVSLRKLISGKGSGLVAPALLLCGCGVAPAFGQTALGAAPVSGQPPVSAVPVPSELELAKLVWSTMVAVDHANQAGNYSVLRDLAAPGFQINNDPAALAQIFASLRATRIDLSNTLLLEPTYRAVPAIIQPGIIRVQGYFGLRPTAINFDVYYQWIGGKWRLFGVSISPSAMAKEQSGSVVAPPKTNVPR